MDLYACSKLDNFGKCTRDVSTKNYYDGDLNSINFGAYRNGASSAHSPVATSGYVTITYRLVRTVAIK